jgi:hypothetical protein
MRSADAGIHGGRNGIPAVVLGASASLLLAFIAWPTIDHDEGYFFQAALHATKTGLPGFPWTDAYYGAHHLYIPLNSLDVIVNWPLAYLPRLPHDTTLWDITIFPNFAKAGGGEAAMREAIRRSDALVLERQKGRWVDYQQAMLAASLSPTGWRQRSVQVSRYFKPVDAVIFTPAP